MKPFSQIIFLLILLAIPSFAEAKTFSVGYQYGVERYYPGAWSALDQGRRDAQKEWSKFANISWAGSSRPNIYVRPTGSSAVWGQVNGNSIYVTYSRKVWKTDAQWKDPKVWKSLFLHEYGHIFILPNGHCNNAVPGTSGKCLMTIQAGRQTTLCPTCLKKLQAKYGKPTIKATLPVEASADERHIAPPAPPLPAPPAPAPGPPTPAPPLPQADSVLVAAAKLFPGVRFHEGQRDLLLVRLAQEYAGQMAAINSQSKGQGRRREGHFGWDARYATIRNQLGLRGVEVSAESWDRQANAPMPEIGRTMFESWQASSGHWRAVSTPHKRFGDGLAKSRHGIWYAAVIVAD